MSEPGSLREAIAYALGPLADVGVAYGKTNLEHVCAAVAQWFRDHETERVEAGGEGLCEALGFAPGELTRFTVREVLRVSDAVVFPAREEKS